MEQHRASPHPQLSITPASFFTLPSEETEAQGKKRGSRAVLALFPEIIACDNHCPTPRATRAVPVGTDRTCSSSHHQTNKQKYQASSSRRLSDQGSGRSSVQPKQCAFQRATAVARTPPRRGHCHSPATPENATPCSATLRAGSAKRYGCRGPSSLQLLPGRRALACDSPRDSSAARPRFRLLAVPPPIPVGPLRVTSHQSQEACEKIN